MWNIEIWIPTVTIINHHEAFFPRYVDGMTKKGLESTKRLKIVDVVFSVVNGEEIEAHKISP